MNKSTFILLLSSLLLLGCKKLSIKPTSDCSPSVISPTHSKSGQIDDLLQRYVTLGLPGISLRIRDQEGPWAASAGKADIANGIDFQTCHLSKTASVTKLFTMVVLMKLVEDGQLSLDDKASNWMPEKVVKKVANLEQATVRQLLNHTSGIYDLISDSGFYLALLNNPPKNWTQEELLRFVYHKSAVFPTGSQVEYSNTNFLLLSMIIDEVAENPHHELIKSMIFQPLAMQDSYYFWHEKLPDHLARGYYDLYNNGSIQEMTHYQTGSGNGYGGIYSTVADMEVFIEALFRDRTLLFQASMDEILQFVQPEYSEDAHPLIKGNQYGLGMQKDFLNRTNPDEYAYGHRGRNLGYSADLFYFPNQDISYSLLVNYGTDGKTELRTAFLDFRGELIDLLME